MAGFNVITEDMTDPRINRPIVKSNPTNEQRAAWAEEALLAFGRRIGVAVENQGDSEAALLLVSDLLADLAHWCDLHNVSFASALTKATGYYQAETEGLGKQLEA